MNSISRTLGALDLIAEKHKALASNLANMDTPKTGHRLMSNHKPHHAPYRTRSQKPQSPARYRVTMD